MTISYYIKKEQAAINVKFTDQFWASTQGRNDQRKKMISSFLTSSLGLFNQ